MKILIIDDEPLVAKTLKRLLRAYDVQVLHSPHEGLEAVCSDSYDLIFCDLMMPEMSGSELYAIVQERAPQVCGKFIFITGGAFSVESEEFLNTSGKRVLYKPFDRKTLQAIIESATSTTGTS
ncbi:MAG: response regulator [Kofleriaceae bacterium]|nr:response regulator [Kofleriaceae bacterium]